MNPIHKFYESCLLLSGVSIEEFWKGLGYKSRAGYYEAKKKSHFLDFKKLKSLVEAGIVSKDQIERAFSASLKSFIESKGSAKKP